jgi:DNA-binding winged helix-turn-helix (wHTH) protein/Tol biopolymer transport system component
MTAENSNPGTDNSQAGKIIEYQFGQFRVIPAHWKLYCGDEEIKLEPKLYDLLLFLIERRDKVVSKDELLQSLWPNMVIEQSGLLRNISLLRQTLGDEPPYRYIETIRNQGYRFTGNVEVKATPEKGFQNNFTETGRVSAPEKSPRTTRLLKIATVIVSAALLLGLTVLLLYGRKTPKFTVKQITTNSAELPIRHAAISPDGKAIAFTDNGSLYLSDLRIIDRRSIAFPDGVLPGQLSWFPNSMSLLVTGAKTDTGEIDIWKVSTLTSQLELLFHDAHLPSASPDGKTVAFVKESDELWLANTDGSLPRLFAKAADNNRYYLQPQFSRDGKYLVALRIDAGGLNSVFESHRISDGQTTVLHQTGKAVESFCLVKDNELMISMMPTDNDRRTQLVSISVQLNRAALRDPEVLIDWPDYFASDISTTADGNHVTIINSKNRSDSYVADLAKDGSSISGIRNLTHVSNSNQPAAWLQDNRTVLFTSGRNGHRGIYRQNIDSDEAQTLIANRFENVLPVITANERSLLYFTFDTESHTREMAISLMKAEADGSEPSMIATKNDFYWMLHCATSAPRCVLEEHDKDQRIFIDFNPDTLERKELLRVSWIPGISFYDWDISPDGTHLAYIDEATDPHDIAVVDLASPTTIKHIRVTHRSALRTLVWNSTGSGFYSSTYDINGELLQLLHIDMYGKYRVLRSEIDTKDGWAIPSRDGKHLLMQGYSPHSNIWLLQR